MGTALKLMGKENIQKKKQPAKEGRKSSVVLEWRGDRAEWRARLRSKQSKSHWQEQTSSVQWIKVQWIKLPLLFTEWRFLLCSKTGSRWASTDIFPLSFFSEGSVPKAPHFHNLHVWNPALAFSARESEGQSQHPCPQHPIPELHPGCWKETSPKHPFAFCPPTSFIFET